MSTTTIYIAPRHLRALSLLAAGRDEVRTYLQGVLVEAKGKNRWLVATDGNVLGALQNSHDDDLAHFSAIIPLPLIAQVCKIVGAKGMDVELPFVFTAQENGQPPRVNVKCLNGDAFDVPTVEGTFPNWRRVIPREVGGVDAGGSPLYMSGALLGRMGECIAGLCSGRKSSKIDYSGINAAPRASLPEHQDQSPWLVRAPFVHNFVGVIMPMRGGAPNAKSLEPSPDFFG